jgi:hypothetical protein
VVASFASADKEMHMRTPLTILAAFGVASAQAAGFKLESPDVKLELPPDATAAVAGFMTNANKIASAMFTAKYGRPAEKK